jgi:hypothetical protein
MHCILWIDRGVSMSITAEQEHTKLNFICLYINQVINNK